MSIEMSDTITDGMSSSARPTPLETTGALADGNKRESGSEKSIENIGENKGGNKEGGFPPPDEPIMVYCLHCGKEYMSSEMVPPDGARTPLMMAGLWWCSTPGCNAGGFGLDIFPVDPEWKDPKGLLHIISGSEEDDDEFEWDEEDEEEDDDENEGREE